MCSTPITSRGGGEVDYPSLSFVRNSEQGLATDEGQKLTIRLHYNPVMDEWVRWVQGWDRTTNYVSANQNQIQVLYLKEPQNVSVV